jgi:hypothetical protein
MNMRFLKNREDWAKWVNEDFLLIDEPTEYPCFAHACITECRKESEEDDAIAAQYLYKKDIEKMLTQFKE